MFYKQRLLITFWVIPLVAVVAHHTYIAMEERKHEDSDVDNLNLGWLCLFMFGNNNVMNVGEDL